MSSASLETDGGDGKEKRGGEAHGVEGGGDSEAVGRQFWEMLTVIMDLLWEPERQNEQVCFGQVVH